MPGCIDRRVQLAPGAEGGLTRHLPNGGPMSIYDASNLVGMGVLPLQFQPGETAASLRLTGEETAADARRGCAR
jgi:aconitate hydratase